VAFVVFGVNFQKRNSVKINLYQDKIYKNAPGCAKLVKGCAKLVQGCAKFQGCAFLIRGVHYLAELITLQNNI